jgi:fermentation-respiration switch protein FrsA (DUF1100 family)
LRKNEIEYREIELVTEDGLRLHAWYTPPQNGALILVAHGHADAIPEDFYLLFAQHGYGVLAWDFRAHGESEGEYSTLGYFEALDVKAALDFALAQPGVEHIGGWGGSMGAATMIRAAAQYPQIEAVVLDSAYTSLREVIDMRVPGAFFTPIVQFIGETRTGARVDEVNPERDIARISPRPLLIIQGEADLNIPADSAQRLYLAAGDPKFLWTEADVPHMNMYAYFKTRYTHRVINFFSDALLGKKTGDGFFPPPVPYIFNNSAMARATRLAASGCLIRRQVSTTCAFSLGRLIQRVRARTTSCGLGAQTPAPSSTT